jgi:NADP-dependent 3-hydroxy acid dehydrogenase YdfG
VEEIVAHGKVVLITGASSGLGNALAFGLKRHGYTVMASMRDIETNRPAADTLREAGIGTVELDVLSDSSVEEATSATIKAFGRIDVLVNNAGTVMLGPIEAATVDDLRSQFESNVFGAHRVVRACLPVMREQGSGLVLQISSGNGRWMLPNMGVYAATKWALEALGECIRIESSTFGVDCVIVELGAHDTPLIKERAKSVSDLEREAEFPELRTTRNKDRERHASSASDPDGIVDPIAELIATERGSRPTRLVIHNLKDRIEELNRVQYQLQKDLLQARGLDQYLSNYP